MSKTQLRNIENIVRKINASTFAQRDIKELLGELREYANDNQTALINLISKKDKALSEAYPFLLDVMHGTYAHSKRNQHAMFKWVLGKINYANDVRKAIGANEINGVRTAKAGLNNYVIDFRIPLCLCLIVVKYLHEEKSNVSLDVLNMEKNQNDILLCMFVSYRQISWNWQTIKT